MAPHRHNDASDGAEAHPSMSNRAALSVEACSFIDELGRKHGSAGVLRFLEDSNTLRVLVVGETIIDEYVYCETLGKAGKEPVLVARHIRNERFAGGILAVANHTAGFAGQVGMVSMLGDRDTSEDFIQDHLDSVVEQHFLTMENAPTITKRRFVELYPFQKIFEVYEMGDEDPGPSTRSKLCKTLADLVPKFDVVVVVDYGHGMIGPEATEILCDKAKFLAVNTQVNAGNRGFNTVSKYPRADFVCVSESEIRLEMRSRTRAITELLDELSKRLKCNRFLVTQGRDGCICFDPTSGVVEVPAFSNRFVDRIGAGDAVLSITALCAAQAPPLDVLGFIGNAVGAQAVLSVGNRDRITHDKLKRFIRSLLTDGDD